MVGIMQNLVYGLAVRALLSDDDGKILIIKRSTDSKTNPGKWEFPGGKVDPEESFDQALLREVYEETNLKIGLDHVVGVSEQNLHVIRAVHIIMSGNIIDGELKLSDEHEGYAWVFFEDLIEYELADWLEHFVNNQYQIIKGKEELDKKKEPENMIKPWLKSIKSSFDSVKAKK
ncbi:MAG: NUDIX domain-containing protein [Methanobacteriaceae archaeon]|nr:NUDIX domain-containing protein [Methanobacteriaceae archaeon]MDP2837496.1 NUDIX domain-containing protein [Methanobacteriaceae archaeon]MDP3034732.1 NUDIX domain-containing protein [Methanobacteriaceae archaeon]MDP3484106.1 NUDIX domain-containing protein [Methanobacteriaceae archaeon]MDP3623953.1 NUDIX domain-containing protein [Methanobacteriaceae archaeon]